MPKIQIEGLNSIYDEPNISSTIKENPDGTINGPFKNVRKFADENNYEKSGILKCLNRKIPHYKNLKFYYENSN